PWSRGGAIDPLGFAMPSSIRPLWGGCRKTSAVPIRVALPYR
ncbi:hypothetical protein A2U01_0104252, partial [Trifolium medium]|nr:hypothetical protein [Trifolium medium]